MDAKFITAGNAIFTISQADGTRHTFRVQKRDANKQYPETYFVSLLTGPDNTSDYSYLGIMNPSDFTVRTTAKSCQRADSMPVRALQRVLCRVRAGELDKVRAAGWDVRHAGRCCRCARLLTTPESVDSGVGPECAEKLGWSVPRAARPAKRVPLSTGEAVRERAAARAIPAAPSERTDAEWKVIYAEREAAAEADAYRAEMQAEEQREHYWNSMVWAGAEPEVYDGRW